ncbi:hypothetical protein RNN33_15335 [Escherichia coli]|nr:hypothetical protein [Escherichia coli]
MEIIKLWRGNSKADGEFCRVVQFVNYGRFYELPYDKRKDDFYLSESIPMHRKMKALRGLLRSGFYYCPNPLNNPELVAVFYEGE